MFTTPNILIAFFFLTCSLGIGWLLILRSRAKKLEKELSKVDNKEPIKPIIKSILMGATFVNNKTGEKDIIRSSNEYGLTLVFPDKTGTSSVRQMLGFDYTGANETSDLESGWKMIRRYYDFSLIDTDFVETIINQEELDAQFTPKTETAA